MQLGEIVELPDSQVDDHLDLKLRRLLHGCFSEHGFFSFEDKRYNHEQPSYRWLIDQGSHLAAHLAVHEKSFHLAHGSRSFIGIAEVCVAKPYRGHGLVKAMLALAEKHYAHVDYSILLGEIGIYKSSGYFYAANVIFPDTSPEPVRGALVKCLSASEWPDESVNIPGPGF
ncbi:MAG: GNAT family N-acetyltransferase [Granulosicoccus sp.]